MSTTTLATSSAAHDHAADGHHDAGANSVLGFWIYLMSDCLVFAGLFATFAVLSTAYAGGPTGKELFDLSFVLIETFVLLFSSLTFGFAMLAAHKQNMQQVLLWLGITFALGLAFMGMEIHEFQHLIHEGNGPGRSAFLSAFFTLVGTHGLHVSSGLLWMVVLVIQLLQKGFTPAMNTRLACLSLFWHFLDIVWIGVFSVVYLIGAV